MTRLAVALAVAIIALAVAFLLRRRDVQAPTQLKKYGAPDKLDRADFGSAAGWLIVVFTSASCKACQSVLTAVAPLESESLAVVEVEYGKDSDLHKRYEIEAVPTLVLADAHGTVHYSALGPQKAAELWTAVTEVLA